MGSRVDLAREGSRGYDRYTRRSPEGGPDLGLFCWSYLNERAMSSSAAWMYHQGAITGLVLQRASGCPFSVAFEMRGRLEGLGLARYGVSVTLLRPANKRTRAKTIAPRVGLVGLLGSGNLGNDGSLEAVFAYLDAEHPDAILDFMCSGPDQITARYGVPATLLRWSATDTQGPRSITALAVKSLKVPLGIIIDAFRTASWFVATMS